MPKLLIAISLYLLRTNNHALIELIKLLLFIYLFFYLLIFLFDELVLICLTANLAMIFF